MYPICVISLHKFLFPLDTVLDLEVDLVFLLDEILILRKEVDLDVLVEENARAVSASREFLLEELLLLLR
jgi:hypothetical protein